MLESRPDIVYRQLVRIHIGDGLSEVELLSRLYWVQAVGRLSSVKNGGTQSFCDPAFEPRCPKTPHDSCSRNSMIQGALRAIDAGEELMARISLPWWVRLGHILPASSTY